MVDCIADIAVRIPSSIVPNHLFTVYRLIVLQRPIKDQTLHMMTSTNSCKYSVSKSNDGVCDVTDMLQNMSTADNNVSSANNCDKECNDINADEQDKVFSVCANCGKEGIDVKNICNKCKQVKYCNASCKKKHRSKHKKQCEEHIKRAAELHDIELFKQPPSQHGDCPICFLRIPNLNSGWKYQLCCGKTICMGCYHAPVYDNQGNKVDNEKCPYCRIPRPTSYEEGIERETKLIEKDNAIAIYNLGCDYRDGTFGMPQNYTKALELFYRAAELGYFEAYNSIGYAYQFGRGVEVDKKKSKYYYELAAIGGNATARHNLGNDEVLTGNMDRALKHYMIAARDGYSQSLKQIKEMYTKGYVSKEDYMEALQSYQTYLGEIKSVQRDKAAAADDQLRYY